MEMKVKGRENNGNDKPKITMDFNSERKEVGIVIKNAETIEICLPIGVYFKVAACGEYSEFLYLDCIEKGEIVFRVSMERSYLKALLYTLKQAFPDEDKMKFLNIEKPAVSQTLPSDR